ncbi:MAG TPA: FtsX-like permease family protein [Solirubrobacterales bacterium]|nr:FtsX-like permease family protein [Solirubrobacterales bacterium]
MSSAAHPEGVRLHGFAGLGPRSLRARKLRSGLTAAGIVLGVGMAFGVLVLVATIHSSFDDLFDAIYGNTDVVVSGKSSVGEVPQDTIAKVREVDGVEAAVGQVMGLFRVLGKEGKAQTGSSSTLFVAGLDLEGPNTSGAELVAGQTARGPHQIEVEESWASSHDLAPGDTIRLATPTGKAALTVSGIFRFESALDLGGYGTAAAPLASVRRMTGKATGWDEINVIAADGVSDRALTRRIRAAVGPNLQVATPAAKGEEVNEATSSLDIVLYFFSGMAIFVSVFLILNSFNMTVLQRIREIGTLRALGASRRRIGSSVLSEALLLAVPGCALGLLLGIGLAELLAAAMRSFFGLPLASLDVTTGAIVASIVIGVLATTVGALYPALRAGRIAPVRALTGAVGNERRPRWPRALAGVVLFIPGMAIGGLFWFSNSSGTSTAAIVGVGSTLMMFIGMVLLAPFLVMPLIDLLSRPIRALMPSEGRLASDSLRMNPLRTSATAAALVVTLSVVVVNATMSASFLGTISDELDSHFARDLTVQPLGYSSYGPPVSGIAPSLRRQIGELPAVGTVTPERIVYMQHLPGSNEPGILTAVDPARYPQVDHSEYEGATTAAAMAGLRSGGAVVGKGFADDAGLAIGDTIALRGAHGTVRAPIVATTDTLEADGNLVVVSLKTMERAYGIGSDSILAITAVSPDRRAALDHQVSALLEREYPGFEAVSNAEVKKQYEDAVNQQFSFFDAIVGIAVIVGLLGIINTLSMAVIERTREIGVLRALGGSRWRIRRTMLTESLLISIAGSLVGIGVGLLVGIVWIISVRESTLVGLNLEIPTTMLIAIAVLGIIIGALAAIIPARRAAHLDPLKALTYE